MEDAQEALVVRQPQVLNIVQTPTEAMQRLDELRSFVHGYLSESKDGGTDGGDYGVIPGTGKKKTLFRSGSEKLADIYGLADRYRFMSKTEDFTIGLFDYVIECELVRKSDGAFVGTGLGSCSSYESKYRWREKQRSCPLCQAEAIIKGKEEYGGGWLCWKKKGGCGGKFADDDSLITSQVAGRVENPDLADHKNTVIKIAKKRAKVDAIIGATRSSGIFTQDLEQEVDHTVQVTEPASDAKTVKHAVVETKATADQEGETHAQKIAKVKAQAKAKSKSTAGGTPATASEQKPVATGGLVSITGINVRNGPMIMKNGTTKPAWGPLYIVTFSAKVQANDGSTVSQGSTFDEKLATAAEEARTENRQVRPVLEAGTKKGSFFLKEFKDP